MVSVFGFVIERLWHLFVDSFRLPFRWEGGGIIIVEIDSALRLKQIDAV